MILSCTRHLMVFSKSRCSVGFSRTFWKCLSRYICCLRSSVFSFNRNGIRKFLKHFFSEHFLTSASDYCKCHLQSLRKKRISWKSVSSFALRVRWLVSVPCRAFWEKVQIVFVFNIKSLIISGCLRLNSCFKVVFLLDEHN